MRAGATCDRDRCRAFTRVLESPYRPSVEQERGSPSAPAALAYPLPAFPSGGSRRVSYFAVTCRRTGGWDWSRPMRRQVRFDEHAAFMDALVEHGFVVLGGPLGAG